MCTLHYRSSSGTQDLVKTEMSHTWRGSLSGTDRLHQFDFRDQGLHSISFLLLHHCASHVCSQSCAPGHWAHWSVRVYHILTCCWRCASVAQCWQCKFCSTLLASVTQQRSAIYINRQRGRPQNDMFYSYCWCDRVRPSLLDSSPGFYEDL